jgi:hypothetical protein
MSSLCGAFFIALKLKFLTLKFAEKSSTMLIIGIISVILRFTSLLVITYLNLNPSEELFINS